MARSIYVPQAGVFIDFPDQASDADISTYLKAKYSPRVEVAPPPPPPEEGVGAFGAGLATYLGQSELGAGRVAQAAGLEGLSKYLYEKAKQNEEYAAKYKPDVANITDIGGVGDAASWLGSTALQTLPNFAGGYAGSVGGTLTGGAIAGPPGALVGGFVGFALSQLPAFIGGNIQEQMQESGVSPENTNVMPATVGATVQMLSDFVADRLIFRGLPITGEIKKVAEQSLIKEIAKIASAEGLSEGAQQAIQIAQANPDKLREFGPEVQSEILNAAAAGIAVGGLLGGASTGIGKLTAPSEAKPTPQIQQDLRAAGLRGADIKRNGEINLGVEALSKRATIGNLNIAPVQTPTGTRYALQDAQGGTVADFSDPVLATSAVDRYKKLAGKDIRVRSAVSKAEVPTTTEATITPEPEAQPVAASEATTSESVTTPARPDLRARLSEMANQWDMTNRGNRSDAWFENGTVLSNRDFSAVESDGSSVPAHGMSKSSTLGQAINDLINLVGGEGNADLYRAPLTSPSGASTGDTASGAAYRDGPFIITFREGATDTSPQNVSGILVNPAHPELVAPLQEMFPDISVRTFNDVADVVAASRAAPINEAIGSVEPAQAVEPIAAVTEPVTGQSPTESVPAENIPPALPAQDEIAIDQAAQEEARQKLAEQTAQIASDLSSQLKQYGLKNVELNFVPAFVNELGRPTTQQGSEQISEGKSIIKISLASFDPNLPVEQMIDRAMEILNHESIHSLSDLGLLRPVEMKMLLDAAARTKVPGKDYTYLDYAKRIYQPLAKTNPVYAKPEAIAEEGVAEMFRDWRKNKKGAPPEVRGIINRVIDIFRRMFNSMKRRGYENIFNDIAAGKVGGRTAAKAAVESDLKAAINPDNEEFKSWFEGSHGTTSDLPDGSPPRTFYTGTSKDVIFNKFKAGDRGIWFTKKPEEASGYALENDSMGYKREGWDMKKVNTASRVIPAYLSYKNPYTPTDAEIDAYVRAPNYKKAQRELFAKVRRADPTIDAILLEGGNTVVVFDPKQIKSTFNTFEPGAAKSDKFAMEPDVPQNGPAPNYPYQQRVPEVTAEDTDAALGRVEYGAIVDGLDRVINSKVVRGLTFFVPERFRPDKANFTAFIQNFADKIMPLGQLVDYVRKNGGNVPDALDPYMQAQLAQSRVSNELEWREDNLYKPVLEAMRAGGITDAEMEEYLYALHAPERNAWIRSINPDADPALGSGMSDEDAARIIARVQADPRYAEFQNAEQLFRRIIDDTNRLRVESGLTPDFGNLPTVDEEGNPVPAPNFQKYVPLRGYADEAATEGDVPEEIRARIGRGFKIRGREDMRAFGRTSRASDLLAHSMLQNSEALIRAAKNNVNLSLLGLIESNPALASQYGISVMGEKPMKRYISSKGVVKTMVDPMYKNRDDVLVAKRDGKDIAIQIDNKFLQKALISAKSGDPDFGNTVSGFLQKMNRFLAGMNTVYNPEFMLVNFPRDLQQAAINITQFDLPGVRRKIIKDALPAVKNVFEVLRNPDAQNDWSQVYKDFREDGGNTSGFWGALSLDERLKKLDKMSADLGEGGPHRARKAFDWITQVLEDSNGAFENAVRLSVYKNVRDAMLAGGVSERSARQRAAMISKNLTVNFDQRGLYGPVLNTLYLFYNASVQGTFALGTAMARSKKVRRMLGGIVVMGIVQDQLNAMMSDGEDDDKLYDKIPDYVLESNLIIMDPFGYTDKGYLKIPLPYGSNAFYNLGRSLSRNYRGKYTSGEAISSIGWTAVDAFNPVGGTESFINFLAPTAIDPLVSISLNNDFSGKRIYPEPFPGAIPKADSQTFFSSTSPIFTGVAQFLNSATGGTEYVPGVIDLSPNVLEYVFDYFTGSTGAFVRRTIDLGTNTTTSIMQGDFENLDMNSLPLLRKLVGNVSDRVSYEDYFDKVNHVLARGAEWKSAIKEGDPQRIKQVKAMFGDEIAIYPAIRALSNKRNQLASDLRKIKENPKIPPEQKRRRIEALRKQINVITERVNKLYNQRIGNKYPGLFS